MNSSTGATAFFPQAAARNSSAQVAFSAANSQRLGCLHVVYPPEARIKSYQPRTHKYRTTNGYIVSCEKSRILFGGALRIAALSIHLAVRCDLRPTRTLRRIDSRDERRYAFAHETSIVSGEFRILILVALACMLASGSAFAQAPGAYQQARDVLLPNAVLRGKLRLALADLEPDNPKTGKPVVTDVMVAAFHLGYDSNNEPYIHLNDNVPSDPMFTQMWQEVATLQSYGVTVRMMLGGAAQGSYADLFNNWSTFYPILMQTLSNTTSTALTWTSRRRCR